MKLTGQIIIKVDGDTIFAKSGQFTFNPGGNERTPQYADNRLIGYTEKPVDAMVSGSCQHTSDTDMRALANHDNVSIYIEFDDGVKWLMRNAFATKPPEISGENGDMAVEYRSGPADLL